MTHPPGRIKSDLPDRRDVWRTSAAAGPGRAARPLPSASAPPGRSGAAAHASASRLSRSTKNARLPAPAANARSAVLIDKRSGCGRGRQQRRCFRLSQPVTPQFVNADRHGLGEIEGGEGGIGGDVDEVVAAHDLVVAQPARLGTEHERDRPRRHGRHQPRCNLVGRSDELPAHQAADARRGGGDQHAVGHGFAQLGDDSAATQHVLAVRRQLDARGSAGSASGATSTSSDRPMFRSTRAAAPTLAAICGRTSTTRQFIYILD